jgi:prolyl-tRNA synthetase
MVLTDAGEDDILYCDACDFCMNVEIAQGTKNERDSVKEIKEGETCPRCGKGTLAKARASEVGNVFDLGQKFTKAFDVGFDDAEGKKQYPIMGCYGIGISRLMGVIVEKFNDEDGILWPETVAPFRVHLLGLGDVKSEADRARGAKIYEHLQRAGIEVLYDDRDVSAGTKFAESDLIGIPWRIVVSPKLGDEKLEVKKRGEKEARVVEIKELLEIIKK